MPSFEHTHSQPQARKGDHFRPGEEADAAPKEGEPAAGLGPEPLSWNDLAKKPEPEAVEETAPEAVEPASVEEMAVTAAPVDTPVEAPVDTPVEAVKPTRIDDRDLPDPGPALLQNRPAAPAPGTGRKRNRPQADAKKNLEQGQPGLVESPAAFEEKLSGRMADRPAPSPRRERKPREESAPNAAGDPAAFAPEGEDAPAKPKRKRRRSRKKRPEGEAVESSQENVHGSTPGDTRPRQDKPRGERSPRPGTKAVAKQPEEKGLLGAVKKVFRSIFGGAPAPAPKPARAANSRDGGDRDSRSRGGNRSGRPQGGQGRKDSGALREGEGQGERPPGQRRRGNRGGKNRRRGGQRRPQGGGQPSASDS